MRMQHLIGMAALAAGVMLAAAPASAEVTRFETELVNPVAGVNDVFTLGFPGLWSVQPETGNSNDVFVYTTRQNTSAKIIFFGTGIDLIVRQTDQGGNFSWSLDNGAQTGTASALGDFALQTRIPIVSGLPNNLHTLELKMLFTTGVVLSLDAVDVYDSLPRTRIENSDPEMVFTGATDVTNYWAGDGGAENFSNGDLTLMTPAASMTVNFTGTSVALLAMGTPQTMDIAWDIDDGTYTGTVNPWPITLLENGIQYGYYYRAPFLLKTDLPAGPHTLKITPVAGSEAGRTNEWIVIDAIDYATAPAVPVELSEFGIE